MTGFALLGHAFEIADKSEVLLRIHVKKTPFLPGAEEYADMWLFPAGTAHNQTGYADHVRFAPGVAEELQQLLYTPETSGGLLAAIPPERLEDLKASFKQAGEALWVIGKVLEGRGIEVVP